MGPTSVIHTSREYSHPIGPKETKALMPKSTKIKTVTLGAQLARLNSCLGWAIVQPRGRGASIPSLKIEKRRKKAKPSSENYRNQPKWPKKSRKAEKWHREIGLSDDFSVFCGSGLDCPDDCIMGLASLDGPVTVEIPRGMSL